MISTQLELNLNEGQETTSGVPAVPTPMAPARPDEDTQAVPEVSQPVLGSEAQGRVKKPRSYGPGFLYVLEVDGFLKLGYTIDPRQRINSYRFDKTCSIITPWGMWKGFGERASRFNLWGVKAVKNRTAETILLRRFKTERVVIIDTGYPRTSEWFPVGGTFARYAATKLGLVPYDLSPRKPGRKPSS